MILTVPASHRDYKESRRKTTGSLWPGARHIVGAREMSAFCFVTLAPTGQPHPVSPRVLLPGTSPVCPMPSKLGRPAPQEVSPDLPAAPASG